MARNARTFVIGDLHGCLDAFERLLARIEFIEGRDVLWLTGDLVNRGPDSLGCLRKVKSMGASVVLGNHDFHLLAVARGVAQQRPGDTLTPILDASDRVELLDWLRHQPLLRSVTHKGVTTVMTHAGLPPQWSLAQATARAHDVEQVLRGDDWGNVIDHLYGNEPACFSEALSGAPRWRAVINTLTRMRFIDDDGVLDFSAKASASEAPEGFKPWFQYSRQDHLRLIFGHWAALEGQTPNAAVDVIAADTGCVWGHCLTAVELGTGSMTHVPA